MNSATDPSSTVTLILYPESPLGAEESVKSTVVRFPTSIVASSIATTGLDSVARSGPADGPSIPGDELLTRFGELACVWTPASPLPVPLAVTRLDTNTNNEIETTRIRARLLPTTGTNEEDGEDDADPWSESAPPVTAAWLPPPCFEVENAKDLRNPRARNPTASGRDARDRADLNLICGLPKSRAPHGNRGIDVHYPVLFLTVHTFFHITSTINKKREI